MKAALISCFDWYDMRLKHVEKILKDGGYNVVYYTSNFDHRSKKKVCAESNNIHYIDVPAYKKNISIQRLVSHGVFARLIYKEMMKEKPNIIYCLIPPNSLASLMARYKKLNKCALLLDIIDLWPESLPTKNMLLSRVYSLWKHLRDNNLQCADYIITECNLYQEILKLHVRNIKCKTIYLAKECIPLLNMPDLSMDVIQLCYLGSVNNIIDIRKIVSLISEITRYKPVILHIIGDGEKKDELINEVRNVGARVEFYGMIFDIYKKQEIFSKCHFGLNIMKDTVCVGLTTKSIDYLQAGLPIINNIKYDTENIVKQYNIGYNITNKNIERIATIISSISISEFLNMRDKTINVFNSIFSINNLNKGLLEVFRELQILH